jgi:hypothetical protein
VGHCQGFTCWRSWETIIDKATFRSKSRIVNGLRSNPS